MPDLTREQLHRLLAWLDSDPERAAEKYEFIRQQLFEFFLSRGYQNEAEALADHTIDRVGVKIADPPTQIADPVIYFLRVALLVATEFKRRLESPPASDLPGMPRVNKSLERILDPRDIESAGVPLTKKRPPAKSPNKTRRQRTRVVSTGFCSLDRPDDPIDPETLLNAATRGGHF